MVQSGVVDKWYSDEVTKLKLKEMGKGGGKYGEQDLIKSKPLTLDHLQGAFYILGCGALLAANVLFSEVITQYLNLFHSSTRIT
ncbi:hypothetical protein Pcinc_000259 [Petrolisthes cinctipes]|uniref:Uncharacterized protein n=1 Tax=Petrolisthes cinctipes TaxID=88211 RepID=A0AAE1GPS2_PETCI|nr:hypothetical protein Pcinc_000259 [Petrolisthes cinctipes]